MSNLYVNLADVNKILDGNSGYHDGEHMSIGLSAIKKINSLPSIDPQEMIDKMIEELQNDVHPERVLGYIEVLQELKQRLSITK